MNKAELKELKTCTKKGLIDLINDPKYINNKANQFPAIVGYLARAGLSINSKESFMDLVYTARNELLAQAGQKAASSKQPANYDLGLNGPAKARVQAFIKNPLASIQNEMKNFYERKENYDQIEDPDEVQYYVDLKTGANILNIELNVMGEQEKNKYEDRQDMVDILARVQKKMPDGDKNLDASLKRINSGFFGTLFRRKSKEYAAFEESFNTFRNANMALSGNTKDLEEKTNAYLKHTIPGFKYSKDMNKEEILAALPKGKRDRAEFCINVLDSIAEHNQMKPYMDNVVKAAKGLPVEQKVQEANLVNDEKQKQFQQEIKNDLEPEVNEKVEEVAKEETKQVQVEEQNEIVK